MMDYTNLLRMLKTYEDGYGLYLDAAAAIEELLPKLGEIVRCGECKHWMDIDNGRQKHEMCAQLMPNWFCADGERKVQE